MSWGVGEGGRRPGMHGDGVAACAGAVPGRWGTHDRTGGSAPVGPPPPPQLPPARGFCRRARCGGRARPPPSPQYPPQCRCPLPPLPPSARVPPLWPTRGGRPALPGGPQWCVYAGGRALGALQTGRVLTSPSPIAGGVVCGGNPAGKALRREPAPSRIPLEHSAAWRCGTQQCRDCTYHGGGTTQYGGIGTKGCVFRAYLEAGLRTFGAP